MRFGLLPALAAFLMLSACTNSAVETSTFAPPDTPGGRLCTMQCQNAADYCRQSCDLEQRQCVGKIQAQALVDYNAYAREQLLARQEVEFRPSDFERPGSCNEDRQRCSDGCQN